MSLKELLRSRPRGYALYMVGGFLPVLGELGMNVLLALMVGILTKPEKLLPVLGLGLILVGVKVGLLVLSRFMQTAYMRDTLYDVRRLAFKKVLNQSYQRFAAHNTSVYISRLVNDINLFERDFFNSLLTVIVKTGNFVLFAVILLALDVPMGLFSLATGGLMMLISRKFKPKIVSLEENVSEAAEHFSHEAANTLAGFEILRLNRVEKAFEDKFLARVRTLEGVRQVFRYCSDLQRAIFLCIGQIYSVLMILYIAWRMASGFMSLEEATFIITAGNVVIWNVVVIFPMYNTMKAAETIYNKICLPGAENKGAADGKPFRFEERLEARHVSFTYPQEYEDEGGKKVYADLNFRINKGEKILLKGPSGAGKTTLLQLLAKVYSPDKGHFLVDGEDLALFSDLSVNEAISYVFQNVFLFEDSIRQNIVLYQDYPEEKILDVVERAGLKELIDSLPRGLDTPLSENGRNLSGGQRQRISIARALIRETPLVFVDEATSGLDPEMGEQIEKTILSLPQTVLAISHRYYKGVSEGYDKVFKIQGKGVEVYPAEEYFRMEGGEPV